MTDEPAPAHGDDFDSLLWHRLCAHDFNASASAMTLRDRLARDNGWTTHYADRVLDEYRRFAYLAVTAGHPVTPSEDVDQAWHLHLLYTRDYWEHYCPEVLGQTLHHGPTRGGTDEDLKFVDWYGRT